MCHKTVVGYENRKDIDNFIFHNNDQGERNYAVDSRRNYSANFVFSQ